MVFAQRVIRHTVCTARSHAAISCFYHSRRLLEAPVAILSNRVSNERMRRSFCRRVHTIGNTSDDAQEEIVVDATLQKIENLTSTIRLLTLELCGANARKFTFLPGMWVDFYIPAIEKVGGYSMVSLPEELPILQLAVKVTRHPPAAWVGKDAKPGDSVVMRAGGGFHLGDVLPHASGKEETQRKFDHLLFVAGGIGINPLYGMARQWANACLRDRSLVTKKLTMMYSCRKREEFVFLNELQQLKGAVEPHGAFNIRLHVTGDQPDEAPSSRINERHLQEALLDSDSSIERTLCYVCGPPAMTDEICKQLDALGFPPGSVRFERWW